jgi:hypothetical protein
VSDELKGRRSAVGSACGSAPSRDTSTSQPPFFVHDPQTAMETIRVRTGERSQMIAITRQLQEVVERSGVK